MPVPSSGRILNLLSVKSPGKAVVPSYFLVSAVISDDLDEVYTSIKKDETESKDILIGFEKEYPTVAKESNIEDILKSLKEKQKK